MTATRSRSPLPWPSSTVRITAVTVLWLISAYVALRGGENPGLVAPDVRDTLPFPWRGVVITWVHTGLYAAGLYWLLRPRSRPVHSQLARALGVFGLLSVAHVFLTVTDMPGYVYVPGMFAITTTILLGVAWLLAVVVARFGRDRVLPP